MNINQSVVHLLSGGFDSVTLLHDLVGQGVKVHCLLANYGQPHAKELEFAEYHCRRLGVLFTRLILPSLGGLTDGNWIVPNRNAILISLAVNVAVKAKADAVTIGCNADDSEAFPDCRTAFVDAINVSLSAAEVRVEVCAPYIQKRKWEIGAIAREIGVSGDSTWSCYRGGVAPCGTCPACEKMKGVSCL